MIVTSTPEVTLAYFLPSWVGSHYAFIKDSATWKTFDKKVSQALVQ